MARRLLRAVAALAALALEGPALEAQGPPPSPAPPSRFEISFLAGYRFEGDLTSKNGGPNTQIDLGNCPTYGITVGYNVDRRGEVEVQYSYARSLATALGGNPNRTFKLGIHDIQLAGLGNLSPPTERVRPYYGFGIGVTMLDANHGVGERTKLSLSVSLGVKAYLSDHVGVRAEFHYIPAYLYTTGTGTEWCTEDVCWNTGNRFLQQFDVRAGATFRF